MIVLSLISALLLFAGFSFLFVTLDFFPYKYQIVEASDQQLTLETAILGDNEMMLSLADSGLDTASLELRTTMIMDILSRIDLLLFGISLALTAFIVNIAAFFYLKRSGQKHAKFSLLAAGSMVILLVAFILRYQNELWLIEFNMRI